MGLCDIKVNDTFKAKKANIVAALAVPVDEYDDLSPKGSVDSNIRDFIDQINSLEACVTTSSCSGRIAVFAEGSKILSPSNEHANPQPKVPGKWLVVSHDPITLPDSDLSRFLGLRALTADQARADRFIHLKFEPFILHILTASLDVAQALLRCAQQAGFRESGIAGISDVGVNLAIRTNGIGFSTVIGQVAFGCHEALVDDDYLRTMLEYANDRFSENEQRILRLKDGFKKAFEESKEESKAQRAQRKRLEGLARQTALREKAQIESADTLDDDLGTEIT